MCENRTGVWAQRVESIVSVIVLSYRSSETIVETLESIKKQDYPKIELIITDDKSPDDTVEICKRWIEKNQHTLYKIDLVTTDKNTGIPGNINRALKVAKGKYIKLIAADDWMTESAITEYVHFMEENPNVMPIAKVKLFCTENPDAEFSNVQRYCDKCYDFTKKTYKEQYRMMLKKNYIVAPAASFYPMDVIKRVGMYDEKLRWFEDYPMNLKIMHSGYPFGLIDQELVYYRMSTASITASQLTRLKKTEMKHFFKDRFWYMVQAGMGWEAIKQCKAWLKFQMKLQKGEV